MAKILIVEDEYIERIELSNQMTREFGERNVFTASTSEQAKKIIQEHTPNIVTLDIMLNGKSGFEVANFIKYRYPEIKIVIITAYNEFDFAHTAMNMGITDYLLKPVRPQAMIEKIKEMIYKNEKLIYTNTVVWRYIEDNIIEQLITVLPFHPNVIGITSLPKGLNLNKRTILLKHIEKYVKSVGWVEENKDLFIIYLKLDKHNHNTISNFFEKLYESCYNIGLFGVKFGVSEAVTLNEISISYWDAINAFNSMIFFQDHNIVYSDFCKKAHLQAGIYPFNIDRCLMAAIEKGIFKDCIDVVNEFVGYCLENCDSSYSILENWANNLKYGIIRYCNQNEIPLDIQDMVLSFTSSKDLYESIYKIVNIITDKIGSRKTVTNPIILKVLNIIKNRYSENISLNMIADEIYFNPIYLSRLFKEQMGCNFKKYLTGIRFGIAVEILFEGNKSISEIAKSSGFNNANYFSKAFKDYYGISPTNYVQQITKKKIEF